MPDFDFTPPPTLERLDPTILASISDDVLEAALIDYVVAQWRQKGGEAEALAAIPAPLRAWYITFVVDGEVLNGGFNQLFFNASAGASPEAPEAFEIVGLPQGAALMRRALAILEERAPALEEAHAEGTIEAFMETYDDDPFSALDAQYGEHEEEFRRRRIQFLRAQAHAIRHP